jgi:hypothetical protein
LAIEKTIFTVKKSKKKINNFHAFVRILKGKTNIPKHGFQADSVFSIKLTVSPPFSLCAPAGLKQDQGIPE